MNKSRENRDKEREVVYSKKARNDSEHHPPKSQKVKPCKKGHCEGIEKDNITSRFHSEGKSQKPTKRKLVRQKSDSRIHQSKVVEELGELRGEFENLKAKYEGKKKEVGDLKATLKSCEEEIAQQDRLIKSYSKKSSADPNKNILTEAQTLTREAIEKYRLLNEQYQLYKEEVQAKLQSQRLKHEASLIRMREEHESKIHKAENVSSRESRQHEAFKIKQQEILQLTDMKLLREEVKRLKLEKEQLEGQLLEEQEGFRLKEAEFKGNLQKITKRVENWGDEANRLREYEDSYTQLQGEYRSLQAKYSRCKARQKEKTREWGVIFQQFLAQISRLKRQIEQMALNPGQRSFQ